LNKTACGGGFLLANFFTHLKLNRMLQSP